MNEISPMSFPNFFFGAVIMLSHLIIRNREGALSVLILLSGIR